MREKISPLAVSSPVFLRGALAIPQTLELDRHAPVLDSVLVAPAAFLSHGEVKLCQAAEEDYCLKQSLVRASRRLVLENSVVCSNSDSKQNC